MGKSLDDAEVNALYSSKKTSKFFGIPFQTSDSDVKRSYLLVYDKETKIITEVRFIMADYEKVRRYEDLKQLPYNIRGIDIRQDEDWSIDYVIYTIDDDNSSELDKIKFEKDALEILAQRKKIGKSHLIKSYEDFKRFGDPKGDDIWKLIAGYDPLFIQYLDNYHASWKGWYDLDDSYFSYSAGKYKIKSRAASIMERSSFKERFPFEFDMSFELERFIPLVMNLPEFESARYAKIEKRNSANARTGKFHYLIEFKINTDLGERHLIIWKDTDDRDGHFDKLIISVSKSGKTYIDTKFTYFTLNNNPWVKHLESIVNVEPEMLKTYHKQIDEFFVHMENDFKTISLTNSTVIESTEQRKIYLNTGFTLSNTHTNSIVFSANSAPMYIFLMEGDDVKDEIYTALTYLPAGSEYSTTPGGYEHEGLFGRCLLVRKNKAIIGMLKFEFTEDGWRMKAIPYSQQKFKESLSAVLEQYTIDRFNSWKIPYTNGMFKSKIYLHNSSISAFHEIEEYGGGHVFTGIFNHDEGFVIESLLAEMGAIENFRLGENGGFARILKTSLKGVDFYIRFDPSLGKLHSLNIFCGGDYKDVTKLNLGTPDMDDLAEIIIQSNSDAGLDLISSDIGTRSFSLVIPAERRGSEPKIILEKGYLYTLTIVYEKSDNIPELNSRFQFMDGKDNKPMSPIISDFGNLSTSTVSFYPSLDKGVSSVVMNAFFDAREEDAIMSVYLFRKKEE